MDGSIPTPPLDRSGRVQPAGCASPTFTGAGFDLGQVALGAVRLTVQTLSSRTGLYPAADYDVMVCSLREADGRVIAPRWGTFALRRHPSCLRCHGR